MKLRIGSRGSPLALAQTEKFIMLLKSQDPALDAEIVIIKTAGDLRQGLEYLPGCSDKQDWIRGLDTALLNKEIDCAVHSGKDVPVDIHPATSVQPVGPRANPLDVFIPQKNLNLKFNNIPKGALIGTASLRRRSQLLNYRSDLKVTDHRGNVGTRLEKLYANKDMAGIILAAAGLQRLNITDLNYEILSKELVLPAVCQGIVFVQYLNENQAFKFLADKFNEPAVNAAFIAERETLRILKADCHSALGIFAETSGSQITLYGRVLTEDGGTKLEAQASGEMSHPKLLSQQVAEQLIGSGAAKILSESSRAQAGWRKA